MFNESVIFALFFGAAVAVLALVFVWLEGVFYFVQDVIARWNSLEE